MRRYGKVPVSEINYVNRPGAYGLPLRSGKALLVQTGAEVVLPGGGVDPNETPSKALHRETLEETGWRICDLQLIALFQRYDYLYDYRGHTRKIQYLFVCRALYDVGLRCEVNHQPFWVPIADVPHLLTIPGEAETMAAFLQQF